MKTEYFFSQRLGFTNAQAEKIKQVGLEHFVETSFIADYDTRIPVFFENAPKNRKEYRDLRQADEAQKKLIIAAEGLRNVGTFRWWLEKMYTSDYPLREKMVLFWHNHFVSSFQKVKSAWSIYEQNALFRQHAFGNFRELTRLILYNNAMIVYLDNSQNRAKAPNENLSRELLELFTLGVGNYTEQDIKDGARALAGLNIGDEGGQYYPRMMDTSDKTYLGKKGNWKADDLVEIIFKHPKAGYLLSEKLLKWFVSDTPSVSMVNEYAEFFRKQDFEIKPILKKLISDKRFLESQGEKIKDPTSFVLQLHQEFQLDLPPMRFLMPYFTEQGMKLLNPPNVKGWDGGKAWLSSQKLIQRVGLVSILASGKNLEKGKLKGQKRQDEALDIIDIDEEIIMGKFSDKMPSINWDKTLKTNKDIINNMTDRLIFATNADLQKDMEQILKYDFNPNQPNAQQAINRLAEYIMKTPEFQIC